MLILCCWYALSCCFWSCCTLAPRRCFHYLTSPPAGWRLRNRLCSMRNYIPYLVQLSTRKAFVYKITPSNTTWASLLQTSSLPWFPRSVLPHTYFACTENYMELMRLGFISEQYVFIYCTHTTTSSCTIFRSPVRDVAVLPWPISIVDVYHHVWRLYGSALGPCGWVNGGVTRPLLWTFVGCVCKLACTHTCQYVYMCF